MMALRILDPLGQLIPAALLSDRVITDCAFKSLDAVLPLGTGLGLPTPLLQPPIPFAPGALIVDDRPKVRRPTCHKLGDISLSCFGGLQQHPIANIVHAADLLKLLNCSNVGKCLC